jgi:hypothetical protein
MGLHLQPATLLLKTLANQMAFNIYKLEKLYLIIDPRKAFSTLPINFSFAKNLPLKNIYASRNHGKLSYINFKISDNTPSQKPSFLFKCS